MQHLLRFLFHLGYFGPFVMGVLDSSFLFLPFGNDLLVVAMTARHHDSYVWYVLMATAGSTLGAFLITLASRRLGEAGIKKLAGEKRFAYLSGKIEKRGAVALAVGCLAPPPFPFTMVVAVTSGLGYPETKLLGTVAVARAARFFLLGLLAILYGRWIIRVLSTPAFKWTVGVFAGLCIVGSIFSILRWMRSRD